MDDYISTTILSADCVKQLNPFICEKDPVFLGAQFRFKDEIAIAAGAIGALLLCIIALSLLWVYKSRKRKKEHLARQDTLRRSARANRNLLNYTGGSSNISKSSNTLNRDDNLSKFENDKKKKDYKSKADLIKSYTDDENSSEYNSDLNNIKRKILTNNRFKRPQTPKAEYNIESENDYHIYDTNEADAVDDTSLHEPKNTKINQYLRQHDSPTNCSIKTTETYYTDTLVRMNEKQQCETILKPSGNQPMGTSTIKSIAPQQHPTPSILKKTSYFGSTYDHLINEDKTTPTTSNNSQRTSMRNSAYFPPSEDGVNDFKSYNDNFENLKNKSNRNLNTFLPKPSVVGYSTTTTNQTKVPYVFNNEDYNGNSSSNYDNLGSGGSSNASPARIFQKPLIPPPFRPAPPPPTESEKPVIINDYRIKYLQAAEAELNAEKDYEKDINQSSIRMKKPQILSEINKSPLLKKNNPNLSSKLNINTNEINVQHNETSTADISKPPPMETSI